MKAGPGENTTATLLKAFKKEYGDNIGDVGGDYVDVERCPTGIFPFDLATGGGIPRTRATIVYGPESSGKTNLLLCAIREHQRLWPEQVCSIVAPEGFDPLWAKKMGVQVDKLVVIRPDYAEQAIDIIEGLLNTKDCGIVGLDSIAAMGTANEFRNSAEQAVVAGVSNPMAGLVRRSTKALENALKNGRKPTLFYINQIRFKVGKAAMFGNPETMPGGNAPKYQSALTVRVYGKNVMDPKVSDVMPVMKHTDCVLQKWKIPVVAVKAEFEMAMLPHNGFKTGECDDWKTVETYCEKHGLFGKNDKGWFIGKDVYPTKKACMERFYTDKPFADLIRKAIVEEELEELGGTLKEENT